MEGFKQKFERYFEKYRIYIGVFSVCFIVFSATVLMIQGANASKNESKTIKSGELEQAKTNLSEQAINDKKTELIFDIEGAVAKPGIYKLSMGSVLADAVNKAGGFTLEADSERIAHELNQASPIGNNAKLYIFKKSDKEYVVVNSASSVTSQGAPSAAAVQGKKAVGNININKANLNDLDSLPGIGPAIAQRIIDWREANGGFEVIEDIKKVKGIGDSLFEGVKNQIIVE